MKIETEAGSCEYAFEDDYVHIYNLFVRPEFRRCGKAREILRLAIDAIRDTGYDEEIQIVAKPQDSSINLEILTEFYKSMGLSVYDYYG